MTAFRPPRRALLATALAAVVVLLAPTGPAFAEPEPPPASTGNEGETPLLRDVLERTGKQYLEAESALNESKQRQLALVLEQQRLEKRVTELTAEVTVVAAIAYRTGRLSAASALLNSSSPDAFLERAAAVDLMAMRDDQTLHRLAEAKAQLDTARAQIDIEVAEQSKQLAVMAKQKQDVEKALALVGGRATGGGYVVATSPVARPAPRNSNGSWPSQGCTQDDPTTGGCLTPRMLHALNEAKRAGFTRYVACYRSGGPYEHPKGRACDFSCRNGSFGGAATGNDRIYGNNLMAFFVRNASRLGVLYVIWYKMIWSPAAGWRTYSGANGDPSSNHTNHVHVSII
jgi:hypothetical protein